MTDDTLRAALDSGNYLQVYDHRQNRWLSPAEAESAIRAALAASATEEPVGPVRIRSANCQAGDHDECLGMVEQDTPGLGITDCLCQCHPFAASATEEPTDER